MPTDGKTPGGFDPASLVLGGISGLSNMLTGGAQRRAEQRMYDQQRMDSQRQMGVNDAQFRAGLAFNKDQDRYSRAMDQYQVGRQEEADAYRRANTNALAPARQELLGALMARFLGGGVNPNAASAAGVPGLQRQWAQQFASQAPVTTRADAGALQQAASAPYTATANPLAEESAAAMSKIEQEARQRAEGSIQNKLQQFARGERDPREYAARLGFDFNDPANRDKWLEAFMADDAEYQRLKAAESAQAGRTGANMGAY